VARVFITGSSDGLGLMAAHKYRRGTARKLKPTVQAGRSFPQRVAWRFLGHLRAADEPSRLLIPPRSARRRKALPSRQASAPTGRTGIMAGHRRAVESA
jgi:hypothetical protein